MKCVVKVVEHINPYLVNAPNVMIKRRSTPISDVPNIFSGNKPVDYNTLKIEPNEYEVFAQKEPKALKYIKRIVGAEELINSKERYCLWLVDCPPKVLRDMPMV